MPMFENGDVQLNYEVHGSGEPLLLIAPGGMRSEMSFWESTPWNPIEQLADRVEERGLAVLEVERHRPLGP